ncbi:uncharacterized protein LOC116620235 [Nematostella vectensis]|uniref:uncharacterized protein LOC116620235 n=1 Tax=Nematostella vectensis TaxID=45351 RepID=UPI00139044A6|nr:uncharacterized protein LOC116620235 [Nematostella vectensis]
MTGRLMTTHARENPRIIQRSSRPAVRPRKGVNTFEGAEASSTNLTSAMRLLLFFTVLEISLSFIQSVDGNESDCPCASHQCGNCYCCLSDTEEKAMDGAASQIKRAICPCVSQQCGSCFCCLNHNDRFRCETGQEITTRTLSR